MSNVKSLHYSLTSHSRQCGAVAETVTVKRNVNGESERDLFTYFDYHGNSQHAQILNEVAWLWGEINKNFDSQSSAMSELEKRLSEMDARLKKHIEDDVFTAMLNEHKAKIAELEQAKAELEASVQSLTAEKNKMEEERNALSEWKAALAASLNK